MQITATDSQCLADPPQVNGEPELFGLNWELNEQAVIVTDDAIVGDYTEVPGYATNSFAKTIQSFQRPLEVSVDMRLKPGTSAECLSVELFGSSSCYQENRGSLSHCGYTAGIGGWAPYGDPFYWVRESEFDGITGDASKNCGSRRNRLENSQD